MKETEALVRMQEIDLALMRDKRMLANMPQAKKLQAVSAARKKVASELTKIVGLRKDAQMDLDENESTHLELEEEATAIRQRYESETLGYREISDLESQLTTIAKRIEKLEFKHKDLVARLQKVQKAERNALTVDEQLKAEGAAQLRSLKEQCADIEREMAALTAEREEVRGEVSSKVLERYDKAMERFGGMAVETLRGNQPSICRVTVPPSSFADIRKGPSIAECPYCHRILVTDGMFDLDE